MVYDATNGNIPTHRGEPGYAIHDNPDHDGQGNTYDIYTDDGSGNGSFVCGTVEKYWARRIAHSLDQHAHSEFDHNGNYLN